MGPQTCRYENVREVGIHEKCMVQSEESLVKHCEEGWRITLPLEADMQEKLQMNASAMSTATDYFLPSTHLFSVSLFCLLSTVVVIYMNLTSNTIITLYK